MNESSTIDDPWRRLTFVLVTLVGVMIPVLVAAAGLMFSDTAPSFSVPGFGVSHLDPVEASLWFCALWIALARQLRRRALAAQTGQ